MQSTTWLSAALLCLVLAACGDTDIKETLGLNRKGPDAFQVYSRPPLTVPPEFSLQPPGKGPEYSNSLPAEVQAHNKVLGTGDNAAGAPATGPALTAVPAVSANPLPTNADAQFLADAGVDKADTHIRDDIEHDKENGVAPKKSTYLLGGKSSDDPVVDADKEATRLKQDKAQNKSPTTGETPVVAPPDKGILGDIF